MSDGSEEGSVTRAVPLPGHVMPVGADALTEQGFRDWVGSVHPVFAQMRLADILVEGGYDRMAVAMHIDEDVLRGTCGVKRGHATLFMLAALAVHKTLGMSTPTTSVNVTSTTSTSSLMKRQRTPAPKVPLAGNGAGCGVVGLGTVAAIRAWMLQLISWTRSNWGEVEASTIADINRDSGAQVFAGLVSEEFDIAMHKAMLKLA